MAQALLCIPDISGFTQFVNNTEIEHSQHVIAELLEILIDANVMGMTLAEVEGDALFYYKELDSLNASDLDLQIDSFYSAFFSHLYLLEHQRICPCRACASAPDLRLKVIFHYGQIKYITVQSKKKPYGPTVIQVHRLLKNSINLDNYILLSEDVIRHLDQPLERALDVGKDAFDGHPIQYHYHNVLPKDLEIPTELPLTHLEINRPADFSHIIEIQSPVEEVFEVISNYAYRHHWVKGVDHFEYIPEQVNRAGTPHVCVIGQVKLNFEVVTKPAKPNEWVYGERTPDPLVMDYLIKFFTVSKKDDTTTRIVAEQYYDMKSTFLRRIIGFFFKKQLEKPTLDSLRMLKYYLEEKQ